MSRNVDLSKPISEDDLAYLQARPWLYQGIDLDDLVVEGQFDLEDLEDEDDPNEDSDESESESDEDEDSDEEEDLEEDEEDEEEDLSELTVPDLKDLARERGVKVSNKATKDELIEALSA